MVPTAARIVCRCPDCTPTPAPTSTRKYMVECHARYVLRKPRGERRDYVTGVYEHAGKDAALELIEEVMRQGGTDAMEIRPGSEAAKRRRAA